jgi:nicotinamide-nucleotide amidase
MQCEILMIGTELLLGQIVDTNAAFMGQVLAEYGINLFQKTTVGDNPDRIRRALDAALNRSEVVLTSGGLGPTEDDITRECVADLLVRPLEFRPDLYEALVARFERFRYVMTENNKKQAYAPRDAIAVPNPNGTAPGLIIEDVRGTIVCMPGVPGELKPMLTDSVIPYLRKKWGLTGAIHSRVLKVCGIGESRIDAAIGDLIKFQQNPTVGVLASPDAVRIRITARAETVEEADRLIDGVDAKVRERLPGLVMGINEATIEQVVDGLLAERGWILAVAETSTGGVLAQRFTAAGSPAFAGGIVLPLRQFAGQDPAQTALRLAEKARDQYGAHCALALVADPDGRRMLVRLLAPESDATWELSYLGADERGQLRAAVTALEHVRRRLQNACPTP